MGSNSYDFVNDQVKFISCNIITATSLCQFSSNFRGKSETPKRDVYLFREPAVGPFPVDIFPHGLIFLFVC